MFTILDAFFDGSQKFDFGNAAIIALVSILIVFTILALIIGITHLLFDAIDRVSKRIESKKPVKAEVKQNLERKEVVKNKLTNDSDTSAVKQPKKNKKEKVGRNDPCPCGSGKKYKQCCGK